MASCTCGRIEITPMEPMSPPGMATMRVVGAAIMYAPDAPTPLMKEITGFFAVSDFTAMWM